jgi:phosphoglycerol transferase
VHQVYQLPETPFPPDPGIERMAPYDHARPYLWSQRLRWSWPNFSLRQDAWIRAIGEPGQDKFTTNLVASGFDGLWLDRFGYKPSDLATVEAELAGKLGQPVATSRDGRHVLFSLAAQRARWLATGTEADRQQARETLMEAIQVRFDRGFYGQEVSPEGQRRWRWSPRFSTLTVRNPTARVRTAEFRAELGGNPHGVVTIKSGAYTVSRDLAAGPNEVVVPIQLAPNSSSRIEFSFEGPAVDAPRDPRSLYFTIVHSTVQELK